MPLFMCPNCDTQMQEINRNEIHIDMCPTCRGVWLDRGELEKLLVGIRSEAQPQPQQHYAPPQPPPQYQQQQQHQYQQPQQYGYGAKPYKKKTGMDLLFDIFD